MSKCKVFFEEEENDYTVFLFLFSNFQRYNEPSS